MKYNFLKFSLLFAIGFATAIFSSCNQNEPEIENGFVIEARNVINSSDEIVSVGAMLDWRTGNTISQVPYRNRGFTMTLPETLADEHLRSIASLFWLDSMTISDENAKGFVIEAFGAFNENDVIVGTLSLSGSKIIDFNSVSWIYTDRDVVLEFQSYEFSTVIDLDLKKGWNIVYRIGQTFTTQKPSEFDVEWRFVLPVAPG